MRADGDRVALVILLCSFGLKWCCNVKITIFKVIFYLIYLFILIKNYFAIVTQSSWNSKTQAGPGWSNLYLPWQYFFQAQSSTLPASVNLFSVILNEKMWRKNIKSIFIKAQFSIPLLVSRFVGSRYGSGNSEKQLMILVSHFWNKS